MHVRIAKDFTDLDVSRWDAIVCASALSTVSQSLSWQRAWWRAYREGTVPARELHLVTVNDDAGLRAIAPMMIEEHEGKRVLKLMGGGRSESLDLIAADDDAAARALVLDDLLERRSLWDTLEFNYIPTHSPTIGALRTWAARAGFTIDVSDSVAWPTTTIKSAGARVDEEGAWQVERFEDAKSVGGRLKAFFIQHIQRWSTDDVPSLYALRSERDLARYIVEEARPRELLLLAASKDGETGAFAFGLRYAPNRLWCEIVSDIRATTTEAESAVVQGVLAVAHERGIGEIDVARASPLVRRVAAPEARRRVLVRVSPMRRSSGLKKTLTRSTTVRRGIVLANELRETVRVRRRAAQIVEETQRKASAKSRLAFYDAGTVTRQYVQATRLQKPEQAILRELRPRLHEMRVLDVAVGAGRTVPYFGTLAQGYRAFDFAPNMVAACQQLVGDLVDPSCITYGDARAMTGIASGSCDLVLISYNGIDDMGGDDDRGGVLAEVKRVLAPDGLFCFSSHNLRSITPAGARGLFARLHRWRRFRLIAAANPGIAAIRRQSTAMIKDVGFAYNHAHYYIAPSAQVRQLAERGFKDIRVFSLDSGEEVRDPARWDQLIDSWVYYLCRG